ncbi:SDR family oxidoreductase (plasmid) [Rhodococcus sp. USK10]|uniref:SDR family NAD(P)-dependent oxidoreductase n=1 Tax=Rhodococcus sp. USK10 TaxID=2789739 RepID=UPI001C5FB48A|nr:SDR family NAD(P)-dependent oxidoreductase [Rhodococcus sp. USK10]QYB00192.1 SDR family oxidoreductase [Rhodococcus sp. USK10]
MSTNTGTAGSTDSRLHGLVAIVTGGGSQPGEGVATGRAAALVFARSGAKVLVVDRDLHAADITVKEIVSEGGVAAAYEADLTDSASAAAMAARAHELWGRIDILDNNIGANGAGSVVEAADDVWQRVIDLNIGTIVNASKAVIPFMAAEGSGAIVNLASVSATRPRGLTPYSMAKGAVISLTRAMAIDHAPQGIRVNCIAPGPIYTPMVAGAGMNPALRERRRTSTPLAIEGTGWDVAHAALYLVSPQARYITGVMIPVDGGGSIKSPQS